MHHLVVVHLVSAQSLQKFGRGIYIEHKSWCGRVRSACHILWQEVSLQEMLPLETMHVFEGLHILFEHETLPCLHVRQFRQSRREMIAFIVVTSRHRVVTALEL